MNILIGLLSACSAARIVNGELLSVIVVHRHGDRTPLYPTYPTDPYKDESHWPVAFGQLTNRGIQRSYDLGKWLRSRYSNFLQPSFSPKFFRAYSTDVDRTLMSAAATLAGLFPPTEADVWNNNLNWRPIPVHTKPKMEDPVLAMKKHCPKYAKLYGDLLNSEKISEMNAEHSELFRVLTEKTRRNVSSIIEAELVHNALQTQVFNNKSLPEWTSDIYPGELKNLAVYTFKLPCYSQNLSRLRTGLFFDTVVKHFKNFSAEHKFVLFSAHDTTLSDILTTIKYDFDEIPPYSSAIMFELHKKQNSTNNYVRILYKNDGDLVKIRLKSCDFHCGLEKFGEIFDPIMLSLEQWNNECQDV